jgi:hypothetical protein
MASVGISLLILAFGDSDSKVAEGFGLPADAA